MADDVVLGKIEIIERCLRRIDQEYAATPANLWENLTRQDSIVLNLERACQASIDLALRLIKLKQLGLPKRKPAEGGIHHGEHGEHGEEENRKWENGNQRRA